MRILILNWRDVKHPRAGGADFRLQHVYAPLTQQGHEVILYACAFPGSDAREDIDGVQVHRLGNDYTFSFLCAMKLKGWINENRPDVVVEDLNKLPFYSPWNSNAPLVIQMHHLWKSSIFKETNFLMAFFIWASEEMIRFAYRKCRFSVVSESTRDELIAMKVPAANIRVIHNGADLSSYAPSSATKEPYMLWIGRVQKYKGPIDACDVLKRLADDFPELKLVIVGDGPFLPEVKKHARDIGLKERVEFTGFISEEKKIDLLQRAAIHLQPSYKEGWGLSVIEANCCGCPVVANNTTGLRDSVSDGETGLLYDYRDLDDAAAKVQRVLTDDALRARLVAKGLEWGRGFSWERNTQEMLAYLQEVVDARR